MSKTLGNVISIEEMLEKFGVDGTRYLLMSAGTFGEDVDVTVERMIEKYNADLANGLGNLVSRIIKLCEAEDIIYSKLKIDYDFTQMFEKLELWPALEHIWTFYVRKSNKLIEEKKIW